MQSINYKLFLLLTIVFCFNVNSQVMWQVKSETATKWYLQDNDEFTNSDESFAFWKSGYPWGPFAMSLDLIYKLENIEYRDGVAAFITKKEATTARVNDWDIDKNYLKKYNKSVGVNNEYQFDFSSGAVSSLKKFKYGYFEMRFKANKEQGMWPAFWLFGGEPNEEIDFYEGKGDRDNQIHIDVHCPKGCDDYKGGFLNLKKNWGAWVKLNESLADGWNIVSGEWQPNYIKFFLNGQPIGYFEGEFKTSQYLIINTAVAKNNEAFNPGPNDKTKWPNELLVDYVRVWSLEDTIYRKQNDYKLFQSSSKTIESANLYETSPKGKVNFVYNKKSLNSEVGTITLLPILYNKYSLSLSGKNFGKIQIDVFDRYDNKVAGFGIENTEYYVMDLSNLETGPYKVKILVLGQTLTQEIPVLNPAKIGEQD